MPDKNIGVLDVDYMRLLYENRNISVYELDAIHLGKNPNGFIIDEDCVNNSLSSFANMPMYGVIDNQFNPLDGKHNDFMEHFREEFPDKITRDRILPFGVVPESGLKNAKLVDRNGHTYLRMQVVVWKKLLPHVSEILQRRDGDVKVSVEFIIDDSEEAEDGYVRIKKFTITAITALGAKFKEVMDGAKLKTVKFSYRDYFSECTKNYFAFSEQKEHQVPEDVLSEMRSGIYLRNKYGRGSTKQLYNSILSSVSCGKIFDSTINEMKDYFSKLQDSPSEDLSSSKYITFKMFGGDAGKKWVGMFGDVPQDNALNISINNSKESAIKDGSWSNPGKKLYDPIMESKNTGDLIKEAYLVVENGYEDAPSEKLKYPHHVVVDNKELILSVPGVEAAFQRAKQMGIVSGDVKAHLLRHYKELGLSVENFSELDDYEGDEYDLDEKRCEELEEKCSALEAEKEEMAKKCAELEEKCAKMSEIEEKCAKLEDDVKCASEKLSVYVRKEDTEKNLNAIQDFAHCFDDVKLGELKKCAEKMSCDEMKTEIQNAVMEFAKLKKTDGASAKFSVNPFFDFGKLPEREEENGLDKIIRSSKTKVN